METGYTNLYFIFACPAKFRHGGAKWGDFLLYSSSMHWQDWVLTIAQIVFIAALIPSVLGKDKPAFSTSLINGFVMLVIGIVYVSLVLWFTAFSIFITASLWFTLAIQKYMTKPKSKISRRK